jgi:hypothetical protein
LQLLYLLILCALIRENWITMLQPSTTPLQQCYGHWIPSKSQPKKEQSNQVHFKTHISKSMRTKAIFGDLAFYKI